MPLLLRTFLGNGYLAVSLFFILSGFILAYTYEGQIEGNANRIRFWVARFARIYPVYILSLALAFWFERGLGISTRLAVLAMVQAWNPASPSLAGAWNYPAWSLSVEAFFYLCFPFLLPWMSRKNSRFSLPVILFLLAVCVFLHTPILGLGGLDRSSFLVNFTPLPLLRIPEFLLGMAVGLRASRELSDRPHASQSYAAYLAAAGVMLALSLPLGVWVSIVVIPFAILVSELAVGGSLLKRFLSTQVMVLLGGASYSVYLLQFPVRSFTRVIFSHFPDGFARFGAPLTPLILVAFSILVFRFWEEPCRRALRSWFAPRSFPKAKPPASDNVHR